MILLAPTGGLCNRLRAIHSGVQLARDCGSRLIVYWVREEFDMRQYFGELFEPIGQGVKVIDRSHYDPFFRVFFSRYNPRRFLPKQCKEFVNYCLEHHAPLGTAHLDYAEFYVKGEMRDYGWLKPLKPIRDRIEEELRVIGSHAIGLHVRRTDNEWSKKMSPLSLFVRKIEDCIVRDPVVRFFLASDDEEVRTTLVKQFPGRIYVREKVANRSDAGGVADAVVDLMLLSKMEKVYGSFGSSFSVVASQIGNVPLEILSTDDAVRDHDERFNWKYMRQG